MIADNEWERSLLHWKLLPINQVRNCRRNVTLLAQVLNSCVLDRKTLEYLTRTTIFTLIIGKYLELIIIDISQEGRFTVSCRLIHHIWCSTSICFIYFYLAKIRNFTKIIPLGVALFDANRRLDVRNYVAFFIYSVNSPKNTRTTLSKHFSWRNP